MKEKLKQQKGITLIALVITIIVLLILAGVTIATLTGENGILTRASEASTQTEIGAEKEGISVAYTGALAGKNGETNVSADDMNEEFSRNNTNAEAKDGIKVYFPDSQRWYKIDSNGNITGPYASEDEMGTTLGDVYTDEMIGQNITYSSNGQSNWIVFGKDEDGNILITTELPIDGQYELNGSAENWLTYEEDLHNACSGYGGTIQGTEVTSRSITMEDINYVAGFTEPEFETYTFGESQDYANHQVNYYFPSESAASSGYWQQPSSSNAATFENYWYGYYCNWNDNIYYYWGADIDGNYEEATTRGINTENCQYIWGGNTEDTCYNEYLVASRAVEVNSDNANFGVAHVCNSGVGPDYYCGLCNSNASGGNDYGEIGSFGIRPVVVLPSSLQVEEQSGGIYDLVQ